MVTDTVRKAAAATDTAMAKKAAVATDTVMVKKAVVAMDMAARDIVAAVAINLNSEAN